MRRVLQLGLVVLWAWAFLVIFSYNPLPRRLAVIIAFGWAGILPLGWRYLPRRRAAIAVCCLAIVLSLHMINRPSNDRVWAPDQEHMITASFEGDSVTIGNLRHMVYDEDGSRDIRWYQKNYDISHISRMDFVIVPISTWKGIAHTLVTFGFDDGEYLSISVEGRREEGESYSPLQGIFRKYEVTYIIGDERDLIGNRLNVENLPVYVFPIKAPIDGIRQLFVSMLNSANDLNDHPEHYNTLTRNCTTSIVRHVGELKRKRKPFDLRIVFPGYAADLIHENGFIDVGGTKPESWEYFKIKNTVPLKTDAVAWSAAIRTRP